MGGDKEGGEVENERELGVGIKKGGENDRKGAESFAMMPRGSLRKMKGDKLRP